MTSCSSAVAKISFGGGLLACGLMGENLFQDCPDNFINSSSGWVLGSHSACLLGLTSTRT